MQHTRHRIRRTGRSRRLGGLAALAALALAALTTASATLPAPTKASAGPVATADETGLGPCRIPTTLGIQMSEGIPTPPGYSPSTGEIRALNLMIDFSDAVGEGRAVDRLAEFFPQTSDWFRTSSYGRLSYTPHAPVPEWLRMPMPFAAYGIERGSPYEPGYRNLVEDIVAVADPKVDFSAYDLVNILVTPNAGPSALDTVLSVTFSGNHDAPVADGVPLANTSFVYSRQDDGSGSYAETGYRVLPHENGHVFGLPDLYTSEGGGSVGHWDIMSEDWGANNDLLGWHKWKLGLAGLAPDRVRLHPGHDGVLTDPAGHRRRREDGDRADHRGHGLRRRGPDAGRQRRGRVRTGRPDLPRAHRRGHRAGSGDRLGQQPGQRGLHPAPQCALGALRRSVPARGVLRGQEERHQDLGDPRGQRRCAQGARHPLLTCRPLNLPGDLNLPGALTCRTR